MIAIFKKEIKSFFTSAIGYLIIALFLLFTGLFLWVFKGSFNIFEYGFSDLSNFFLLAPWVFLFLIPAVTMKSFSEEKKLGTLELLIIKPISTLELVCGKFLGAFALSLVAIIPTTIYVISIHNLGLTEGNFDIGVVIGSYFGLLFLIATYTSIGVFSSSITDNQILSFILAIVLCFIVYFGFDALASLSANGNTQQLIKSFGAKTHFDSIAQGIIDTRDIVYFAALTFFFCYLTCNNLNTSSK